MRMAVSKQVDNVDCELEANKTKEARLFAQRGFTKSKEGHEETLVSHKRHQKPKTVRVVSEW